MSPDLNTYGSLRESLNEIWSTGKASNKQSCEYHPCLISSNDVATPPSSPSGMVNQHHPSPQHDKSSAIQIIIALYIFHRSTFPSLFKKLLFLFLLQKPALFSLLLLVLFSICRHWFFPILGLIPYIIDRRVCVFVPPPLPFSIWPSFRERGFTPTLSQHPPSSE